MDTIVLPDLQALMTLLVNPLTMGAFISWLLNNIPLIKNPATTNWIKFAVAIAACFVWSLFVWVVKNGGLPTTSTAWYSMLYMGIAVAFSNQGFYQLAKNLPGWLLALFGKSQPTITMSTSSVGTTAESTMKVLTNIPTDTGKG